MYYLVYYICLSIPIPSNATSSSSRIKYTYYLSTLPQFTYTIIRLYFKDSNKIPERFTFTLDGNTGPAPTSNGAASSKCST